MPTGYEASPTPSRSFPAVKTPLPIVPERRAGGVIVRSILDEIEDDSLSNIERLMALSAQVAGIERRWSDETA